MFIMANSPEYRSLTICVGELKRFLNKQENDATLNDMLKRFVQCSTDQSVSTHDEAKEEEHGRESRQALVDSMLKLIQQHPHKYHEFLQGLKDVPSLHLLHRSLSQAYCLGSDKLSLLHQFEDIKSKVMAGIESTPSITPQHLLDAMKFLELPEIRSAYKDDTAKNSSKRRTYVATGLFREMSLLSTFTGFRLLQHIITKTLNRKDLMEAIKSYDDRVQQYKAQATLEELMNFPPCQHEFPPGFSVFQVEIQKCTLVTLKGLDEMKDDYCMAIKQKHFRHVLNFIGVSTDQVRSEDSIASCFFAMWRFPSVLLQRLEKASERNASAIGTFCKANSVLSISVDGNELVHNEEKVLMTTKSSQVAYCKRCHTVLCLLLLLSFLIIIVGVILNFNMYEKRRTFDDEIYEELMNSLTNHSFEMIRSLIILERQESYTSLSVIALLFVLIAFLSAACWRNTVAFQADLHQLALVARASNSRFQQMELSSIAYERHQLQLLHSCDSGGPASVQCIEDTHFQ